MNFLKRLWNASLYLVKGDISYIEGDSKSIIENKDGTKYIDVKNSNNIHIDQRTGQFPETFKTWEHWLGEYTGKYEKYFSNDELTTYMQQIQTSLTCDTKANLRVIGFAGLGKTRLVFEALKGIENISNRCIYCNAAKQESEISKTLLDEIKSGKHDIIIVDNCDSMLYQTLIETIGNHPKIHIFTIYHQPDENVTNNYIRLVPENFEGIIPKMLKHFFSDRLSENDRIKISHFAQGFPEIAVQMSKALLRGNYYIGVLSNENLVRLLIGSEGFSDRETMKVLKACSIFSEFGYRKDLSTHKNYIGVNIARLNGSDADKLNTFQEICFQYKNRGILEEAGRFVFIRPKPLAVHLAGLWWQEFMDREDDAVATMTAIHESGLWENLCKQMRYLNFLPEAQQLTADLCGQQAPFGQTEVINTDAGSRLFRTLAEVNPKVITETLYTHYADANKAILQSVQAGRRNLVWTLEKLCFRKETFEKAAKIMMAFAYGENESYGNNATIQFTGLFKIFLAGTEVNLEERLKIIQYGLNKEEIEYKRLALNGITKSLAYYGNSVRMLGAEKQGSSPDLIDYIPTFKEAQEYTESLIKLLVEAACSNEEHGNIAIKILEDNIRSIYANRHGKFVPDSLRKVHASRGNVFWEKAFINLLRTIEFEQRKLPTGEVEELNKLVSEFAPQKFDEYYQIFVEDGTFWKIDEDGNWSMASSKERLADDYSEANISVFVNKFIADLPNWNYTLIVTTASNNGYFLGKVLAEILDAESSDIFINNCIEAIKTVDKEKLNLIVLGSFLQSCSDEIFRKETLNSISQVVDFNQIISLTAFLNLSLEELKELVQNSQEKGTAIEEFNRFCYGRALAHLTDNEIIEFSNTLKQYGERGVWVALHIITTYFREDEAKILSFKNDITALFKVDGAIENIDRTGGIWLLIANRYIEIILKNDADEEFIQILLDASINHIKNTEYFGINDLIKRILTLLLTDYFDQSWDKLGALFITDGGARLKSFLGAESTIHYNSEGLLFRNSDNYSKIIEWCKINSDEAPRRIATISPTFNTLGNDTKLHPFAKLFIDEFGDREDVRSNFSANINSFTSVGSRIPYLQNRIELLEELKSHPTKEVRQWVTRGIRQFKEDIKQEKIRNEEDGIR